MASANTPIISDSQDRGGKLVESRTAGMIREVFKSGRPLTYIRTAEEQRVAGVLVGKQASSLSALILMSARKIAKGTLMAIRTRQ